MDRPDVVGQLTALGLTAYEAKVFSALTRLGEARVGEIHVLADVPRSAVYGTLERLEARGIIEGSTGRPRKFRALPPKAAISKIESELLRSAKGAREGLEELASTPQHDSSDARIWIVKGIARVQEKMGAIVASARSELFVAGNPESILAFKDYWAKAKARRIAVTFASTETRKTTELARYGEVVRPSFRMKKPEAKPLKVLFVRADRRVILFATEYEDERHIEDLTAFWTDDESVVRFMNYLTEAMSTPAKKGRRRGTDTSK